MNAESVFHRCILRPWVKGPSFYIGSLSNTANVLGIDCQSNSYSFIIIADIDKDHCDNAFCPTLCDEAQYTK